MALSRDDRVDTWLRSQGLPFLVPRKRRRNDLLQRSAPCVVLLLGVLVLGVLAGPELAGSYEDVGDSLGGASTPVLVAITALALLGPPLAAWWLWRAHTSWTDALGRVVALALVGVYVLASVAVCSGEDVSTVGLVVTALAEVAGAHLVVWSGLGSLLAWAGRWAWKSLGAVEQMTSRALPVILVLVVFAYFSTEPWQIADSLSLRRQLALSAVIATIAAIAILPVARSELSSAHRDLTADQAAELLAGTPLQAARGPHQAHGSASELSRGARANVLAVLILAHLIQAAMFLVVIAGLLTTIGRVAITDRIVTVWLGHPRVSYTLLGDPLPLDHQSVRTAFLLGVIGALSFVMTSLSDPNYRNLFFDPLTARVKVAVAAHRALHSRSNA